MSSHISNLWWYYLKIYMWMWAIIDDNNFFILTYCLANKRGLKSKQNQKTSNIFTPSLFKLFPSLFFSYVTITYLTKNSQIKSCPKHGKLYLHTRRHRQFIELHSWSSYFIKIVKLGHRYTQVTIIWQHMALVQGSLAPEPSYLALLGTENYILGLCCYFFRKQIGRSLHTCVTLYGKLLEVLSAILL